MKIKALLFMLLLCSCGLSGQAFGSASDDLERADFPVILMYHDIKLEEVNGFDVSANAFARQLDWLQENGYRSLSADEYIAGLKTGKFPAKSIFITFDDGYEGVYAYAAPELRRHHMKAVFFVIKNAIGTSLPGYPYMTEAQLRELSEDPLFAIEPHTLSHPDLSKISGERLSAEIGEAKTFFESLTGKRCQMMAFPYGSYNADVLTAVEKAGYEASFAVGDRGLLGQAARFSVPRIYMGSVLKKNDMELFKRFVQTYSKQPADAFAERFGPLP